MFLASFLIGLREGLEASLIIGILLAYVTKLQRGEVKKKIWLGVWLAVGICLALGALFTFGRYGLSFVAQEIIGGSMSLLAVAMITWMVFWMMGAGGKLKHELEQGVDAALAIGTGWAIFWFAFVTVAREGIETTLLLWGWAGDPLAFAGAITGIVIAAAIGVALNRGALRINLRVFFAWTGAFLIIVAAGVLAYGIHDLQEATVLPGPFSGRPITPTNFRTGEVLTGFEGPFWLAAYPFGWAFNVEGVIEPSGTLATFLKGIFGFVPQMSWLEVSAWALYIGIVFPLFFKRVIAQARDAKARIATTSTQQGEQ
ncbi:iron uptake transporter permease EfeU [Leucobacter chinensis]|uniref:iron uptake transporter permease EfeU n=1 Tax=Leucobacter chinensis TaxID=2851010 RepID=UPI001C243EFE|nr:iron uptake transporter permease EfeU [Leucobacter chinensis]